MYLGKSLISWKCKKQQTVSRSSTEAEYKSMALAACELIWLQQILTNFKITVTNTAKLLCDNKLAIHIATNLVFHECTKHIEIDCRTIRDQVKNGFICRIQVVSANNHADIFTKPLYILLLFILSFRTCQFQASSHRHYLPLQRLERGILHILISYTCIDIETMYTSLYTHILVYKQNPLYIIH